MKVALAFILIILRIIANINQKDIENTTKSVFDENFKRQAMSLRGVLKDIILEYIINGKKYTESLKNYEAANGVKISFRKK